MENPEGEVKGLPLVKVTLLVSILDADTALVRTLVCRRMTPYLIQEETYGNRKKAQ